jgi:plastocyanin
MGRWGYAVIAAIGVSTLGGVALLMRDAGGNAPQATAAKKPAKGAATGSESAGAYGFSHVVTALIDGKMVPVMKEGPEGRPIVRCQSESLPCSYLALKTLSQSGAPIPPQLKMTRDELKTLVSQLDTVSENLKRYKNNIDQACVDGYRTVSGQVGNMGIHMSNSSYSARRKFDLTKPEILLFATPAEGAEQLPQDKIGNCVDGKWTGDPKQQIVGAAFLYFSSDTDHPEGFAGPIDNWHVHYHQCIGTQAAASMSKEECVKRGGLYLPVSPWMLHVYAVPEFDNPLGVFAIWNSSIWPRTNVSAVTATKGHAHNNQKAKSNTHETGPVRESVIFEFRFAPLEVKAGETVVFRNADPVFHTVTSGTSSAPTATFDSGNLFAEQTFKVKIDKPGMYQYFCRLHPDMTGTLVVK